MIHVNHLTHAYRQAPWRVQLLWAGAFLLGVLVLAMVSLVYLDVTSKSALMGREIQELRYETTDAEHTNADLQTELANLLSSESMMSRALALGFRPAEAGEIHYLIVPGYAQPSGVVLATTTTMVTVSSTPPEYTQSLIEWITEYLKSPASGIAGGVLP